MLLLLLFVLVVLLTLGINLAQLVGTALFVHLGRLFRRQHDLVEA